MYNLYFIEEIQKGMKRLLDRRDEYNQYKNEALSLKEVFDEKVKVAKQVKDKNSEQYKNLVQEINELKEKMFKIAELGEKKEKQFDKLKQYILEELKNNKNILEKYKDSEDIVIEEFKDKVGEFDTEKRRKLEENISNLQQKLKLNNLSPEEIRQMNREEQAKVNEIREEYLNNSKKLEKYEKLKYVALLGNDLPENRIMQYEKAIEDIENEFSIENIENVISKLEQTLDIEKQKAQIKFNLESNTYTYIDERGKKHSIAEAFVEEDGVYKSILEPEDIETTKIYAKLEGLSKKQIDMIDYNLVECLMPYPKVLDNYFETIKRGEPVLNIEYNFEGDNKKFDKNTIKQLQKVAKKQEKIGIATRINKNKTKLKNIINKTRVKVAGFFAIAGLSTIAGYIGGSIHASANTLSETNEKTEQTSENDKLIDNSKVPSKDNKDVNKDVNKNVNKDEIQIQEQKVKEENEIKVGDYGKIPQGAMLFSDPTDWLRIKNGLNANEKVVMKGSDKDKLYKIEKEGYYSLEGEFVVLKEGQDLEEVLKEKGLDSKFIKDKDTINMYHVIADGIAQWVSADDFKKENVKVDKLGNIVGKTEEQKEIDEAMERYNKQKQENTFNYQKNIEKTGTEVKKDVEKEEIRKYDKLQDSTDETQRKHIEMLEILEDNHVLENVTEGEQLDNKVDENKREKVENMEETQGERIHREIEDNGHLRDLEHPKDTEWIYEEGDMKFDETSSDTQTTIEDDER